VIYKAAGSPHGTGPLIKRRSGCLILHWLSKVSQAPGYRPALKLFSLFCFLFLFFLVVCFFFESAIIAFSWPMFCIDFINIYIQAKSEFAI